MSTDPAGATIAAATRPGVPIAGPLDRQHFRDAQQRHRRATWRATALAIPAVMAAGIPLCVIVTPILVAPLIVAAFVLHGLGLLEPHLWDLAYRTTHILPDALSAIQSGTRIAPMIVIATLALPGAVAMLLVWLALRLLLGDAWISSVLERLDGRSPDRADPAERALCNIAEELAVAASIQPPRILIVEDYAANATIVGRDCADAVLLVSAGLLKTLDRDETQALIAHLISSAGNGDLKIAATFFSVFESWGLLALLIETPFNADARSALGYGLRVLVDCARGTRDSDAERYVVDDLLDGAAAESGGFEHFMDKVEYEGGPLRNLFIDLPRMLTFCIFAVTARAAIALCTALLFGPPISGLWRARRRLADARAVELTRNPGALASAVERLHNADAEVEGGEPISFLFPLWPKGEISADRVDIAGHVLGMQLDPHKRLHALRRLGSDRDVTIALGGWEGWRKEIREIPMLILALALALVVVGGMFAISLAGLCGVLLLLWEALSLAGMVLPS